MARLLACALVFLVSSPALFSGPADADTLGDLAMLRLAYVEGMQLPLVETVSGITMDGSALFDGDANTAFTADPGLGLPRRVAFLYPASAQVMRITRPAQGDVAVKEVRTARLSVYTVEKQSTFLAGFPETGAYAGGLSLSLPEERQEHSLVLGRAYGRATPPPWSFALGVISTSHALQKSFEDGLSGVEISFDLEPPARAMVDAITLGDAGSVRTLLHRGVSAAIYDLSGASLLHLAARGGHLQIVQLLLAAGADPNAVDRAGATPLVAATAGGYAAVAADLLRADADPDVAPARGGWAPLHSATARGEAELVRHLVRAGADPDLETSFTGVPGVTPIGGLTALHIAAATRNAEVAKILLDAGADANAANSGNLTPLHLVAGRAMPGFVIESDRNVAMLASLLLEHGGNPEIRSRQPHYRGTVRDVARNNDAREVLRVLRRRRLRNIFATILPLRSGR